MITILPNVLSLQEINLLMDEVDPKNNYIEKQYSPEYTTKKVKCSKHPVVLSLLDKLPGKIEWASVIYYPVGAHNPPHADNSSIEDGIVTRVKDWNYTAVIFLNNEFTGGELIYPNQGCVFLPTVGTMVITPAGPDYIHFVNEVKTGERFTLVLRII